MPRESRQSSGAGQFSSNRIVLTDTTPRSDLAILDSGVGHSAERPRREPTPCVPTLSLAHPSPPSVLRPLPPSPATTRSTHWRSAPFTRSTPSRPSAAFRFSMTVHPCGFRGLISPSFQTRTFLGQIYRRYSRLHVALRQERGAALLRDPAAPPDAARRPVGRRRPAQCRPHSYNPP